MLQNPNLKVKIIKKITKLGFILKVKIIKNVKIIKMPLILE